MIALTFKPASLRPARLFAGTLFAPRATLPPWDDAAPIRAELFSAERLEQHADSLAAAQPVTRRPIQVVPLRTRLDGNARVILAAYRASAATVGDGVGLVPAAEWLLDNYHLVEEQIAEIRSDLPPGYYKQLPKLAEGPFAGYPRVFGVAWAYVAHTDSHLDPNVLRRFLRAYQQVQALEIGELWAVPITLRIVLIENLRRLADQITMGNAARQEADLLADRLLASKSRRLDPAFAQDERRLTVAHAAQLAKRLRDQDPRTTPALAWLEDRLRQQGTTLDEVVLENQQRQGASNVTIRNVILSLKLISQVDWAELFESVSLVDARFRWASDFADMDFATRNLYRSAIEQLARRSPLSETEVADKALEVARLAGAAAGGDTAAAARLGDPGYYLIASGRRGFERAIGFRPPARLRWSRWGGRLGLGGYVGAILLLTAAALAFALAVLASQGVGHGWLAAFGAVVFLPATEMATSVVNRVLARQNGPAILPGLELLDGVPAPFRTMVAVPTLLTGTADILEQVGNLEVHFLAADGGAGGGDMVFALLSDGVDAPSEVMDGDAALIETARAAVQRLNERHGTGPAGVRFLLLHRHRRFNPSEGVWMGWERKRGKLHELNQLLRGATDTSYMDVDGRPPAVPPGVRYVITLDADTRLPRGAALRLVGKMAHPLNRPVFPAGASVVSEGYAILQPRVTPALPMGREGSFYQSVFSAPGGIDPYSAAVSDVYQDLLGEGSYTGKGIYEVDGFERALAGRVPDNAMLSHDLFEGVFARAGLASDVEVIEEYPTRYDVAARRQHRWTRGDWQLLPWILGTAAGRLPQTGRWKMLDNLRRSLLAPLTMAALALAWLQPVAAGLDGVLLVLGTFVVPIFLSPLLALLPVRPGVRLRSHLRRVGGDALQGLEQLALLVAFLPDTAWRMVDAIVRTLGRLYLTRRNLLEWVTAAQSSAGRRPGLAGFYRFMAGGTALGVGMALVALALMPRSWAVVLPFGVLWAAAPAIAMRISRPAGPDPAMALEPDAALALRRIARRTWRFFEVVVTPRDHMLPPDNLQEDPVPVLARRTSPTNIGLYLLSCVVARDFGWVGTTDAVERLEAAFASMDKLAKFNGHLLNWYATEDLRALDPPYVSTVDSGNLAGHLVALANAVEEWIGAPVSDGVRSGLEDALLEARAALRGLAGPGSGDPAGPETLHLAEVLDGIGKALGGGLTVDLGHLVEDAAAEAQALAARRDPGVAAELVFWTGAMRSAFAAHVRDRDAPQDGADPAMPERLRSLARQARAMALGMDFAFLLDPERELLSIGYAVNENRLDVNRYDLLASEARLASLFAIAKGDVPTRHWFRLGRPATPLGRESGLISWAGSMFEYLMPSLVMRAPAGSLLDTTNRLVVQRQMAYGAALGVPWGVSESAYNARDVELTYQYAVFGVPGLGLKRGLSENVVMAPYATGLATMVDPQGALTNYGRLAEVGASSGYGFYEAVDFTPSRLPEGARFAVVRTSMAHHQGMTVVAIANALQDGRMRQRFHREPMIQACELLLQERMPRDVARARSRSEDTSVPARTGPAMATARQYSPATEGSPVTHLLSNGRYSVMLTLSGGRATAGGRAWR